MLATVFPYLHIEQAENSGLFFNLPLYSEDNATQHPVIAFCKLANQTPEMIHFPEEVDMGSGELVRNSLENLRNLPLVWREETDKDVTYLTLKGHPLATEKILDPAFLINAATRLDVKRLVVGIPCKGLLIAGAGNSLDSIELVEALTYRGFNNIAQQPISDVLYYIEEGKIIKTAKIRPSAQVLMATLKEEQVVLPTDFEVEAVTIPLINDLYYYKFSLSTANQDKLFEGCMVLLNDYLEKTQVDKNFIGSFEFLVDSTMLPKTPELETAIDDFLNRISLSSSIKTLASRAKRDLEVAFVHSHDFTRGDMHLKKKVKIIAKS